MCVDIPQNAIDVLDEWGKQHIKHLPASATSVALNYITKCVV